MKMTLLLLPGICPVSTSADREENTPALLPLAEDLLENIPEDFPRFWFAEHDADAQWLSRYLWHHFSKRDATLQGSGTAGGLGIDHEFYESSLMPSIVIYGFLELNPNATDLVMRPQLPAACPDMGAANVLYRGVRLDIRADAHTIRIRMKDRPREPQTLDLGTDWMREDAREAGPVFLMREPGLYRFKREAARE